MSKRQHLWWIAAAVLFLTLAVLACGPQQPAGEGVSVTITSPASGVVVHVGEQVQVISMASAEAGVARVELLVNGQLVRTDAPPSGNPTSFAVAQQWSPVAPGEETISVVAYDVNGAASEPAAIAVRVEAGTAGVTVTPSVTQTPMPDVLGEGGCTLNASYVADVTIPDDTQLLPGTTFAKTWRIRNSGTCNWGSGFKLVFVSGDQMGAPGMVAVPPTAAGSTADVTVNMTAPATPGTYRSNWRMQSDTGLMFGSSVYVRIVVPAPVTVTPTTGPTLTPTAGPTSETPAPPSNLLATLLPDGTVRFTWTDAVGEAQYRYEFSFVAGGLGAATASTLPANTTSWNGGHVDCGGTGGFTIIALAGDGSEIGRQSVSFSTPACEGVTVILTPIASLSGSLSEGGCDGSIRAGIAPAGNGIRGVVSFDIASLNSASDIVAATLDLSSYTLTGNPFEFLRPLHVRHIQYVDRCDYPAAYSGGGGSELAAISAAVPGLTTPIDVRTVLKNYLDSGDPTRFQIRLYFEGDDGGSAYASMANWSTVRLTVTYRP